MKHIILGQSHSIWVRGLKQDDNADVLHPGTSHSIWVRGLKLALSGAVGGRGRRTLYGCVD